VGAARVDGDLGAARRGGVGGEGGGGAGDERGAAGGEDGGGDAGAAGEGAARHAAGALGALEREAGARCRRRVGRAGARGVPRPGRDEAAVGGAARHHVQVPAAAEGAASSRAAAASAPGAAAAAPGLGRVLYARGRAVACALRGGSHPGSVLHAALDVEVVIHGVQRTVRAADVDAIAVGLCQGGLDGSQGVRRTGGGHDPGGSQPRVRWQCLEEGDDLVEEVGDLLRRLVVDVTLGVERRDARAVRTPLVLPEGLWRPVVAEPVRFHVRQQRRLPERGQDLRDVGVCASAVARLLICAITIVGLC
jgi:hypothetical protein